jgi:hypothetical protein
MTREERIGQAGCFTPPAATASPTVRAESWPPAIHGICRAAELFQCAGEPERD